LKKGKVILITFVIISIVFAFNTYINQRENQRENTRLADQIFKTSLSEATTGFGVNYSKMNEDGKIFYYLKITSNLNTAMNTLDLTSYKHIKNRNKLFEAIYNLYWCMTRNDSRNAILSNNNMPIIFDCLSKIANNPEDEKDCEAVSKLAGDLYFNHVK
jgi:hypothetical protein